MFNGMLHAACCMLHVACCRYEDEWCEGGKARLWAGVARTAPYRLDERVGIPVGTVKGAYQVPCFCVWPKCVSPMLHRCK